MSSRLLQPVFLSVGGRIFGQSARTLFSKQFFSKSGTIVLCSENNTIGTKPLLNPISKMPIISAAVIAHRHLHQKQSYKTAPQLKFVYPFLDLNDRRSSNIEIGINNSDMYIDEYVNVKVNRTCASVFATSWDSMTQLGHQLFLKESRRFYAKGKDRVKSKKSQVIINEDEINSVISYEAFKNQLEQLLAQMKEDFTKQLSIRGSSGALESIQVEFENETHPLQELAQVGRKNPQLAVLNLSSLPDAIPAVIKAIQDSGMNLNPQQEGTTVYVPLPKVTREHREILSKNAKAIFTKYKTSFQSVQNRYIKQCKSHSELSEDVVYSVQQQIMKITESYVTEADKLTLAKQKELVEIK